MLKNKDLAATAFFILITVFSFWQFFFDGKIPIAGDVILGTYHPWLEKQWGGIETIFPVLNPTISDSVTSFYPWKYQSINLLKHGNFPLLDDSTYMGNPLFATGTTGVLYPLNILFFLFSFNYAWGLLVVLTPIFAAIFFYLWLRRKGLDPLAVLITSIAYAFSSFLMLQVTFINSPHSVLWLPLVLLCIDRLLQKISLKYFVILVFALFASLSAGFFQGSLYLFAFSFLYFLYNWIANKSDFKKLLIILAGFCFPVLLSAVQLVPFVELVKESSRLTHYGGSAAESEVFQFFVQFKYLITTIIPDFFGNPGKWNYFGEPNYYEFNNFVGTVAFIGFLLSLVSREALKKVIFFIAVLIFTLVLATPNPIGQFPYFQNWPVISSLIPARLLAITQFCMVTLSAYGLTLVFQRKITVRRFIFTFIGVIFTYLAFAAVAYVGQQGRLDWLGIAQSNWKISFRNTLQPLAVALALGSLVLLFYKTQRKAFLVVLVCLASLELVYQTKFSRPFIAPELLYPKTPLIEYLQENSQGFRYMITSPDLLPSNLQTIYGLESVDGSGPLFPDKFNQMIGGINYKRFDKSLPRFRRTVFLTSYDSPAINLLGIKYVLSSEELETSALKLVLKDGETYLYENSAVLPKSWIAGGVEVVENPTEAIKTLKSPEFDPKNVAITAEKMDIDTVESERKVMDFTSSAGTVTLRTRGDGVLVFSEQFYPGWKGFIDGVEVKLLPVNYDLIGLKLPPGEHQVRLLYRPESFKIGLEVTLASLAGLVIFVLVWRVRELRR